MRVSRLEKAGWAESKHTCSTPLKSDMNVPSERYSSSSKEFAEADTKVKAAPRNVHNILDFCTTLCLSDADVRRKS